MRKFFINFSEAFYFIHLLSEKIIPLVQILTEIQTRQKIFKNLLMKIIKQNKNRHCAFGPKTLARCALSRLSGESRPSHPREPRRPGAQAATWAWAGKSLARLG